MKNGSIAFCLCVLCATLSAAGDKAGADVGVRDSDILHLSEADVKSVKDECLFYSITNSDGVVFMGPHERTVCDRVDVLTARTSEGLPVPPFRVACYSSGAATESWFYPDESERELRERPMWNLLTDPIPVMNELFGKGALRNPEHKVPLFSVSGEGANGEVCVTLTNAQWISSMVVKCGSAWPENAYRKVLLTPEYGMVRFPSWRKDNGPYDLEADCVGVSSENDKATNVWSMARYCRDPSDARTKRYLVRLRVWDLEDEKTLAKVRYAAEVKFSREEGLIVCDSVEVEGAAGRMATHSERKAMRYSAVRNDAGVTVLYDGEVKVVYMAPEKLASVLKLQDEGVVEWDELVVDYPGGSVQVFSSWMLFPQDFQVR